MHALEQAADLGEVDAVVCADLVLTVVTGLPVLLLAVVIGEVVTALDEQPVCGASGNTLGAWLAEIRVSTELGATHAPARATGGGREGWRWGLRPYSVSERFHHRAKYTKHIRFV